MPSVQDPVPIVDHGDPATQWVLVILGDGFAADEQDTFDDAVGTADGDEGFVPTLRNTAPFDRDEVWERINIYRVNVISATSGISVHEHALPPGESEAIIRNPFFNTRMGLNPARPRLPEWARGSAHLTAEQAVPEVQSTLLVLNSTRVGAVAYWPEGAMYAQSAAFPSNDPRAGVHEFGHMMGLADEYLIGNAQWERVPRFQIRDTAFPNVTYRGRRVRQRAPWSGLMNVPDRDARGRWGWWVLQTSDDCAQWDQRTMADLGVTEEHIGLFEGAWRWSCGCYRSQYDCLMKGGGSESDFCAVCQDAINKALIAHTRPSSWWPPSWWPSF